jgi:hypothetical protein
MTQYRQRQHIELGGAVVTYSRNAFHRSTGQAISREFHFGYSALPHRRHTRGVCTLGMPCRVWQDRLVVLQALALPLIDGDHAALFSGMQVQATCLRDLGL